MREADALLRHLRHAEEWLRPGPAGLPPRRSSRGRAAVDAGRGGGPARARDRDAARRPIPPRRGRGGARLPRGRSAPRRRSSSSCTRRSGPSAGWHRRARPRRRSGRMPIGAGRRGPAGSGGFLTLTAVPAPRRSVGGRRGADVRRPGRGRGGAPLQMARAGVRRSGHAGLAPRRRASGRHVLTDARGREQSVAARRAHHAASRRSAWAYSRTDAERYARRRASSRGAAARLVRRGSARGAAVQHHDAAAGQAPQPGQPQTPPPTPTGPSPFTPIPGVPQQTLPPQKVSDVAGARQRPRADRHGARRRHDQARRPARTKRPCATTCRRFSGSGCSPTWPSASSPRRTASRWRSSSPKTPSSPR